MNEQTVVCAGFGITTIRKFSKKHNLPEHLIRSLCKRGELPGFYQSSRFYINEGMALDKLNSMSTTAFSTETADN